MHVYECLCVLFGSPFYVSFSVLFDIPVQGLTKVFRKDKGRNRVATGGIRNRKRKNTALFMQSNLDKHILL